jgi:hypothetical protein
MLSTRSGRGPMLCFCDDNILLELGPSLGSSSRLEPKFRLAVNKGKARARPSLKPKSSTEPKTLKLEQNFFVKNCKIQLIELKECKLLSYSLLESSQLAYTYNWEPLHKFNNILVWARLGSNTLSWKLELGSGTLWKARARLELDKTGLDPALYTPCLFILGSQNVDFLATCAEITNLPKCKQIIYHRRAFMYHRFP